MEKDNFYKNEMIKEQKKLEAWTKWEEEQLEQYEGEVFITKIMEPIPWHSNNTRRYNVYNDIDIEIIVDAELVEEDGEFEVVEL